MSNLQGRFKGVEGIKHPPAPFFAIFRAGEIPCIVPFKHYKALIIQIPKAIYTIILQDVRAAPWLFAHLFCLDRFRQNSLSKKGEFGQNLSIIFPYFSHFVVIGTILSDFQEKYKNFSFPARRWYSARGPPLRKFENSSS